MDGFADSNPPRPNERSIDPSAMNRATSNAGVEPTAPITIFLPCSATPSPYQGTLRPYPSVYVPRARPSTPNEGSIVPSAQDRRRAQTNLASPGAPTATDTPHH